MRSKAEFRALRELCGITQSKLADALGVEVRSVKRWEHPTAPQVPPADAWDVLDDAMFRQRVEVDNALDTVERIEAERGSAEAVELRYWLNAEEYAERSTDARLGVGGDWLQANANTRAVAVALMVSGHEVTFTNEELPRE